MGSRHVSHYCLHLGGWIKIVVVGYCLRVIHPRFLVMGGEIVPQYQIFLETPSVNSWTYFLMQRKKVFGDHLPIIMMMKPGMFVRYIATTTVGMLEWVPTPPGQNLGYPCLCPLLFLLWAFDKCPHDTPDLQIHQDFVHWPALLCSYDDQHRLQGVYPLYHWFEYGFACVMNGNRFPFLPVFLSMEVIKTMSDRRRNGLLWRICLRPLKKQICCTSIVLVLHFPPTLVYSQEQHTKKTAP